MSTFKSYPLKNFCSWTMFYNIFTYHTVVQLTENGMWSKCLRHKILESAGMSSKMQILGPYPRSGESELLGRVERNLCYQNVRFTVQAAAKLQWKNYIICALRKYFRGLCGQPHDYKTFEKVFFVSISSDNLNSKLSISNSRHKMSPFFSCCPFLPNPCCLKNTFDN